MLSILERYFFKNYLLKALVVLFVFSLIIFSVLVDDLSFAFNDLVYLLPYLLPMSFKLALAIALSLAWLISQASLAKSGEWVALSIFGLNLRRCAILVWIFGLLSLTWLNLFTDNFQSSNMIFSKSPKTLITDKGIIYNFHNKQFVVEENKDYLTLTEQNGVGVERGIYRNNESTPYLIINLGKYHPTYKNRLIKYNSNFNLLNVSFLWTFMIYFAFLVSRNNFVNRFFAQVLTLVALYICNIQLIKWVSMLAIPGYIVPAFLIFILGLLYEK